MPETNVITPESISDFIGNDSFTEKGADLTNLPHVDDYNMGGDDQTKLDKPDPKKVDPLNDENKDKGKIDPKKDSSDKSVPKVDGKDLFPNDNEKIGTDNTEAPEIETFKSLYSELGFDFDATKYKEQFGDFDTKSLANFVTKVAEDSRHGAIEDLDPAVKKFHDYISNGGKEEDYFRAKSALTDYSQVDVATNEFNQMNIIRDLYQRSSDFTPAEIQEQIDFFKEKGKLGEKAAQAKEKLVGLAQQDIKNTEQKALEQRQLAQKEAQDSYNTIVNFVTNSDKIGDFPIDKVNKDKLLNYLFKPVVRINGQVVSEFDSLRTNNKLSLENEIKFAYLSMLGFSTDALATIAKTKTVQNNKVALRNADGERKNNNIPKIETSGKAKDAELGSWNDYLS